MLKLSFVLSTAIIAISLPAISCTRVLSNASGQDVLVGRTMDWPETTEPVLTVLPRGLARDGGLLGGHKVVSGALKTWQARYGSLVTTVYGLGTADGMNEKGLAAHMLFFKVADFGKRDEKIPAIQGGIWAQYLLDNAATVTEALALMQGVQIVPVAARGSETAVHLAIEDASGDSAVIEYVGGQLKTYHGHQYRIMTNDPPYDEQLALLAKYDFSNPTSDTVLPGNVNPRDRFARAAYFLKILPKPADPREAVAGMLGIARNVSVPFGAPYKEFGIYNTEYRTVANLTQPTYVFELSNRPNVIWIDLRKLNFGKGAPVLLLHPDAPGLAGEVSARMEKGRQPF